MDHRRALTPKLSSKRAKTPYDRPVTPSNRTTKSTQSNNNTAVRTPGSIFSRVKNLFTPRAWRASLHQHKPNDDEDTEMAGSGLPEKSPSVEPFQYPEPESLGDKSLPNLDRFNEISTRIGSRYSSGSPNSTASSPNQRLAEFFKKKGEGQLSEMEIEGVMALINQAKEQNESVIDLNNLSAQTFASPGSKYKEYQQDEEEDLSVTAIRPAEQHHNNSVSTPIFNRNSSKSPAIASPATTPRYSPFYSSSTKRQSLPSASSSSSSKARKTIHYANIPTPYRPGSRTGTKLHNPLNFDTSQDALISSTQKTEEKGDSSSNDTEQGLATAKKPMSQTASTLLSLIGDEDVEEEGQEQKKAVTKKDDRHYNDIPDDLKSFVNPYASPARRQQSSSPKKQQRKTGTPSRKESPKPNAVKELEKTMPKQQQQEHQQQSSTPVASSNTTFDKYKPSRSSGLRKSIVASPEKEEQNPKPESSSLFKASTPTDEKKDTTESTAIATKPPLFSSFSNQAITNISPSKPLASAVTNTPSESKPTPTTYTSTPFKFGVTSTEPLTPEKKSTPQEHTSGPFEFLFPRITNNTPGTFAPSEKDLAALEKLKSSVFKF